MEKPSGTKHDESLRARLCNAEALQYCIPLLMQIVLIAVLLSTGQWIFALMLGSGALTTSIPWMLRVLRRNHRDGADVNSLKTTNRGNRRHEDDGSSKTLAVENLEHLIGCDDLGSSSMWRRIVHGWLREPTLRAPVAIDANGPYAIDLNLQGPHALVAGTTGSGKSVLLQSWCLAMAARNSPDHLRFVFMDFKGGSTFNELARLPHTIGNVCDLDLQHSIRALIALERELKRRERLAASHGACRIGTSIEGEPELIVVIDEFHALKDQLPDYVDRLVRVASLGRSLGMHIIACTQNPIGQVSANMKANMSLKICLRVLDAMQSNELLGTAAAAGISPKSPGTAICNDGERRSTIRCAVIKDVARLVTAMVRAHRFMQIQPPQRLFTAPLPGLVTREAFDAGELSDACTQVAPDDARDPPVIFGIADDCVRFAMATLPLGRGNIAIIGPTSRGKSTLLHTLDLELSRQGKRATWLRQSSTYAGRTPLAEHVDDGTCQNAQPEALQRGTCQYQGGGETADASRGPDVWLIDDADALLDPLCVEPMARRLRELMQRPETTVVFCVETSRHIHIAQRCTTKIIFPTGDRATDLADGIDARLLGHSNSSDRATPGRAVLMHAGTSLLVQCFAPRDADAPHWHPGDREPREPPN